MDTISISKLSKQALKKLEKGLPVRVKAGEGHTLELDTSKVAKLGISALEYISHRSRHSKK